MDKVIKVRGHYKYVKTGDYEVVADLGAVQETTIPIYKKIWVPEYTKTIKDKNA